jgi:hypothetical protein
MAVKLPSAADMGARRMPGTLPSVVRGDSGEASSRALGAVGRSLAETGERLQAQADETAVQDAQIKFNQFEVERIHDPEKGAKLRLGKDAIGVSKSLPEEFDRYRDDVLKGLSSNRARAIVGKIAESRREQVQTWAADHEGQQRRVYEDSTFKGARESAIQRVALDPSKAAQELAMQTLATQQYLTKRGRTGEIEAESLEVGSSIHSAALSNYLETEQFGKASEYFKANRGALTAAAREKYQKDIDEAGVRVQSQANADRIIAKAGSRKEALAEARKIGDAEVRDATEQRVSNYWSQREQDENEQQSSAYSEALKRVYSDGAKTRAEIPVQTWNAMSGEQQGAVLRAMQKDESAGPTDAESKVFYELEQLAADNPQKFGELDLTHYFPHLARTHQDKLSGLQRSVKSGEIAGFKGQVQIREELVNDFYKAAKGKTPEADALRRRFDEAVQVHIGAKGRRPDVAELRAIRDGLTKEVVLKDRSLWFDDKRKVYEIGFEDVPEADRKEIEAALKKAGRSVSEQAVVDLYLKGRQ